MLAGYPPFFDDNPFGIYEKILRYRKKIGLIFFVFAFIVNPVFVTDCIKCIYPLVNGKTRNKIRKQANLTIKMLTFFFTSGKIDWPRHIDPVAKDLIKKFLVQVILIAIVILIIEILTISIAIANPIINSLLLLNIDYHHI